MTRVWTEDSAMNDDFEILNDKNLNLIETRVYFEKGNLKKNGGILGVATFFRS